MMSIIEKLKKYVNTLNLTEQFAMLIGAIMLVMTLLITFFLNNQVNNFVDMQMYEIIRRSQQVTLHTYITSSSDPEMFDYSEPSISHYIISINSDKPLTNVKEEISPQLLNYYKSVIFTQQSNTRNYRLPTYLGDDLFTVTRINDRTSIVTSIATSYQSEFKNVLSRTIFYILLVILLVNITIILMWVFSIITPLKKIRAYIDGLGNKNRKPLDVQRNDEIGDVAVALVEMENQIKASEQAKMEMVHNISHDLKTPITTIKSYAESIKDGIYPYDTLEKSIDVIIDNADRLERKAHSLLLLNRMDYFEEKQPDLATVRMQEIVSKVILNIKVVRPEIAIITEVDDLEFNGSEEQWRVCLENLLDNALRYAASKIVITVNTKGVSVYNDGQHMSEDRLAKLFKPYEKGTDGNFGLGLSIVYRIAQRMGYEAKAENVEGGVLFSIDVVEEKTKKKR